MRENMDMQHYLGGQAGIQRPSPLTTSLIQDSAVYRPDGQEPIGHSAQWFSPSQSMRELRENDRELREN